MCANFKPISKPRSLQLGLDLLLPDFGLSDDLYPGHDSALLFRNPNTSNVEWHKVRFGIVPKWAESLDIFRYTYNARTETVIEKPSICHDQKTNPRKKICLTKSQSTHYFVVSRHVLNYPKQIDQLQTCHVA